MTSGPRILMVDCETSPNLAHVWGLFDQSVSLNQLLESTRMICFGARWFDKQRVTFKSEFHHGREEMLKTLWELLDEADFVCGWNSKRFDSRHFSREFLEAGMTPPSPYRHIDLMLEAKRSFYFPSNKLQYVSTLLGLEGKVAHEGHTLWIKCLAGDKAAWGRMRTYQIQDVDLLVELLPKLRPWLTSLPNMNLWSSEDCCDKCGSTSIQRRGYTTTNLGRYARWRCNDCGGWSRSGKSEDRTDLRGAA